MFLSNEKLTESTEYQLLNTVHSNNTSLYVYDNGINDNLAECNEVLLRFCLDYQYYLKEHYYQYPNSKSQSI